VYNFGVTPDPCPLCTRPNLRPSDHHIVPRCRGGKETKTICSDCHRAIHALFSNKELESTYNSVEDLLGNERFARTVKFISKQDPARRTYTIRATDQRRRGRNG
jgi:hypothetical protein